MKKILNRYIIIIIIFLTTSLLSGCWDYTEIEKRGYVLGLAVDLIEEGEVRSNKIETIMTETDVPKYAYTIQLPIIAKGKAVSGTGVHGGGDTGIRAKTWNLTILGNSFFEVNREYSTRLDYPPFYEHLKVVVISEAAAREGMYTAIDFIMRDPEMRRRTKIFITPGKASKVLEVTPKIEDYASLYLKALPNNAIRTSRMLHKTDIGQVMTNLHSGNDFVLPRIVPSKTEIRDAGSAIFKKDKMVGWLDEIKTNYLKWISGYALGSTLTIESPDDPKGIVTLEQRSLKTETKPVVEGEEITFNINTKVVFNIAEINHDHGKRAFDEDFIKEVEKLAEKKAEKQMRETIEYVQKEYGTDTFFFYEVMQRYAPDTWDKVKDDWDNVFPKVKTNIKVSVKIEQVGLIK